MAFAKSSHRVCALGGSGHSSGRDLSRGKSDSVDACGDGDTTGFKEQEEG